VDPSLWAAGVTGGSAISTSGGWFGRAMSLYSSGKSGQLHRLGGRNPLRHASFRMVITLVTFRVTLKVTKVQ